MLEVRLLGQFELRIDGVVRVLPSRPAQSLLAYLVLHAGTPQRREHLAGLLWPDHSEESARRNLRTALWHARKVLRSNTGSDDAPPEGYITSDGITTTFNADSAYWLDARALEAGGGANCSTAELIGLASLYQGELLPGFYDDWVILERDRVEAVFESTMQRLLDQLLAENRWDDALVWSRGWIALGRVPEPAYRALMTAHACLGDVSSAVEAFRRCRSALTEELGVQPSTQTVALYEALIRGEDLRLQWPGRPVIVS